MNGNRNVLGMLAAIVAVAMALSAAVAVGTALGPAWGLGRPVGDVPRGALPHRRRRER